MCGVKIQVVMCWDIGMGWDGAILQQVESKKQREFIQRKSGGAKAWWAW